jgi:HEAT repeat protein
MKTPLLIYLLLILTFQFAGIAQDTPIEVRVDQLLASLQASALDPDSKLKVAWELGLIGPSAKKAIPALAKILANPDEHPKARISALNALGHIGISDKTTVDQITRVLIEGPKVFGGSGSTAIANGSFELIVVQDDELREKGAFGETMFEPGSLDLAGWTTYAGVLMIQDEGARPGGRNSLELGPRDVPGCISQTVLTAVGNTYELKFFACTGRGFAHFNRQLRVRVADVDKTVDCVVGAASEMIKIPFKATSALTTVTFCGVGSQGFGPMIDEVSIDAAGGAKSEGLAGEGLRFQQLAAIAQRIRGGLAPPNPRDQRSPAERELSTETPSPGEIDLLSKEGELHLGHQLEFFDTSEPGVVGTRKPAWISLYRTEGRDFTLTGEVNLGGADDRMLFPSDLPDGFALFLREWGGLQRYQFDSRNITVKRRLLHGQVASDIIPMVEFAPPRRGAWTPFQVRVSESMIEYSFAGNVARLPGPLDTDGANKIAIAPGTRLRNLRLSLQGQPKSWEGIQVLLQPSRLRSSDEVRELPDLRRVQQVTSHEHNPESRMHELWQSSQVNVPSPEMIASLLKVLKDGNEPPQVRRGALNTLGHLGITNEAVLAEIRQAVAPGEELIISQDHRVLNSGFEATATAEAHAELTGAFGETMFAPGSMRLPGWSVYEGPITFRTGSPSPAGGKVIELGPRNNAGAVSQTIRTTAGQSYELKFYTCTGRGVFHFNRQIRIRVADQDQTLDCPIGSTYEQVRVRFRAISPFTTISISGVGGEGFGPLIDDVQIEPVP